MTTLTARIAGVGFWVNGLPSWAAARALVSDGVHATDAPGKPQPQVLAPNERRRAPESVAVALEVAHAACVDAGCDPRTLPSVFASTHGDLAITDYMGSTLAGGDPAAISPTRFHNSVHNAAAGYWTIGTGCHAATTAISAYDGSFAQGLVEALSHLACGNPDVLLVGFDSKSIGPLQSVSRSEGLLGGALVLSASGPGVALSARLEDGQPPAADGALALHSAANAMAPMLPLFDALAVHAPEAILQAGAGRVLRISLQYN